MPVAAHVLYLEHGVGRLVDDQLVAARPGLSLIIVGYLLLRHPVNLMIDVQRPVLRHLVTLIGALVACWLWLSFPG